ncbi:MAG TPA: hypothetical protein VKX34_06820 [Aequorivita sp.]|nr:hypothetical protein [Aequorivita sp.]
MDTKKTNLFYFRTDWKEIVWQHNTRKGFVHKQDLTAVFFNAYIDVKQKIQSYVNRKNEFPENEVNELIFEFRENFSLTGRIEGVNYFDDLILQFIDYYKANNPHLLQMKERLQNTLNKTDKENEIDLTTFENKFDHKTIKDVYQYFNKELVKTNYLSEDNLKRFIHLAFILKAPLPPEQKITFEGDPQKGIITNIFYRYYRDVNGKTKRKGCGELLGEYFNGYNTKTVLGNFNKNPY